MKNAFASRLIAWYGLNGRNLPWRQDKNPYKIWLSEIMLQQTRVEAVKAYYLVFLNRFPTIFDLASASEEEVLKLWEGLGYYSRARNLLRCANEIVSRFGGAFPQRKGELTKLPGIGGYTASAIASICFGERSPAVDGNLFRIYSRLEANAHYLQEKGQKEFCGNYFARWMEEYNPGDINQALMDLGELVCLPNGKPQCDLCPFADTCKAHLRHKELLYPAKKPQKEKKSEPLIVFLLFYGGKVLLRKRPPKGLLASLYEFPNVGTKSFDKARETLKENGLCFGALRFAGESKHEFTHKKWNMSWYEGQLTSPPPEDYVLADPSELKDIYSIPSAFVFGYTKASH